jgi:hypothetical protein
MGVGYSCPAWRFGIESRITTNSKIKENTMTGMTKLEHAATNALADLEGIMPEFEPSGDREHPAWETIKELRDALLDGFAV